MRRSLLTFSLILVFAPCAVYATQASLYLGGSFTGSKLDLTPVGGGEERIASPGGDLGAQLLFDLTPTVALGLDLNVTKFGERNSATLAPGLDSKTNLKNGVVLAVAKWSALPGQPARPYLLGGLGFHSSTFKYEATPAAGFEWTDTSTTEQRTFADDTESAFAAAFGVGLDVNITNNMFLGLEARFVYLGSVDWQTTSQGMTSLGVSHVSGDMGETNLLAKIGYRF